MNRPKQKKGFVLFVVLWVIMIMSVTATSFAFQVRMESQISHHMRQDTQLRWATHGGMHHLGAKIRHELQAESPVQAQWWQAERFHQDLSIADFAFTTRIEEPSDGSAPSSRPFAIQDLESRLNINRATADQLARLPGLNTIIAEDIARFVRAEKAGLPEPAELRTGDDDTSEDENPRVPLRSLNELLQLPSVDEALLYDSTGLDREPLNQSLTALSNGKVNINTASGHVLGALGFDEGQVNTILAVQSTTTELFKEVSEIQSRLNLEEERWQQIEPFITTTSSTFEITGRATKDSETVQQVYQVSAIAVVTDQSLAFLCWQEGHVNGPR